MTTINNMFGEMKIRQHM